MSILKLIKCDYWWRYLKVGDKVDIKQVDNWGHSEWFVGTVEELIVSADIVRINIIRQDRWSHYDIVESVNVDLQV